MPPIAYYSIVKGKDPKLKYETRYNIVMTALQQGIKPTARFFGISKNTVRKWLRRYQQSQVAGLEELSRAPKRIPHKTDIQTEKKVIALKERLPRFGSKRLKRDFGLKCSHTTLDRIFREHGLIKSRKRKRPRPNDLRAEKTKYSVFKRSCNDTKHLSDISEYWAQARQLNLPWFQYSHREVRVGAMFLGYANELSLAHNTVFAELLIAWYQKHGIELEGSEWLYDGGSENIGAWNAKRPSSYQERLAKAGINGIQISKTTYNAEVETVHNTIEFEFFEVEQFASRADFFQKVTTYQLWYNLVRKNCYRQDKSPYELLREISPKTNPKVLLLPVIDLDLALECRVKSIMSQSDIGGHDVPWHARILNNIT